jgi:hypothetical protein
MINFKDKTNIFSRSSGDLFFSHFFDENDVDNIIDSIFNNQIIADKTYFLELLNNTISFVGSFYPDIYSISPGKNDELQLLKALEKLKKKEIELLDTLLYKYGHKTLQHFKISQQGKSLSTWQFLETTHRNAETLYYALPFAQKEIKSRDSKKTGKKSQQAVPSLIYQLIIVYEEISGKSADAHIHQDRSTGTLYFKGEFYDFVHTLFSMINKKLLKEHGKSAKNPFKICLDKQSVALGKQIQNTIKLIKDEHKEAAKILFNYYFELLLSIQPRKHPTKT